MRSREGERVRDRARARETELSYAGVLKTVFQSSLTKFLDVLFLLAKAYLG